jgi:hypothetical protein
MISSEYAHSHHGDRDLIVGLQAGFSRGWLPATNCNRKAGKEHLERYLKLCGSHRLMQSTGLR